MRRAAWAGGAAAGRWEAGHADWDCARVPGGRWACAAAVHGRLAPLLWVAGACHCCAWRASPLPWVAGMCRCCAWQACAAAMHGVWWAERVCWGLSGIIL